MSEPPLSWLDRALGEGDDEATDDPWCEVEVPDAVLTDAQEGYLAAFTDQPTVSRLRGLTHPLAPFEEVDATPDDDS